MKVKNIMRPATNRFYNWLGFYYFYVFIKKLSCLFLCKISPQTTTPTGEKMKKLLSLTLLLGLSTISMADAPLDNELKQAMAATGNIKNGKQVFKLCIVCHGTEGWGTIDGNYPQIAGQHPSVIIKQIADIRAGNRDNPIMFPIAQIKVMGGPQSIADVTAYIGTLKMTRKPELGKGDNLAKGEKLFYRKCAECHGANGQGDEKRFYPRLAGQHYDYVLRQLKWIQSGKRRNANKTMQKRIQKFKLADFEALADYISRLEPPKEITAPIGWKNPDFQ
ncbi:MAG: cytochrome C [Gammaproteobacteria bacterium]|nr:MAG: cytochrome C [Gammaproteobacteria bacterium]